MFDELLLLLFDELFELFPAATPEFDGVVGAVCPGPTKSPNQLPKTFTSVTTKWPLPTKLLFTKLTRSATMFALPVLIVVLPPVLSFAVLPPVFADKFNVLVTFALLFCVVELLPDDVFVAALADPAPLFELLAPFDAVICPSGATVKVVPGDPSICDPGAPTSSPTHVPALLTRTNHHVPPSRLEFAMLRVSALTLLLPVFTVELPPVSSLV